MSTMTNEVTLDVTQNEEEMPNTETDPTAGTGPEIYRGKFEKMSVEQVVAESLELFPHNQTQQLIHIARHASMTAGPEHNPKIITINIVGEGGYGKTGSAKEYCEITSKAHGEPCFMVKRTVGGLIDIESLTGQQTIVMRDVAVEKEINGKTVIVTESHPSTELALPAWFPRNNKSTGILLLDDYNRGVKHVIQGLMDLINEGAINDLKLPHRWVILLTSNPEDGDYEVTAMDYAQKTRTINVAYERDISEMKRQASKQRLCDSMANAIYKLVDGYPEMIACPVPELIKPKVNDRLLFLYARLHPYLELNRSLGEMVRHSTFENKFIVTLEEVLASEQPVSVKDVLNRIKDVEARLMEQTKKGRFDLLNVTVDRVMLDVIERDCKAEELKNLQRFIEILPEEKQFFLVGKLVHGKKAKQFLPIINKNILTQMAALNTAVKDRSNVKR